MKKITVIGANSYIARNLICYLERSGPDVQLFLYDRALLQTDGHSSYTQIDVLSKESVHNIKMNCDIIFMFVGKTGSANGFDDIDTFIDINQKALLNVLNEYRHQRSNAKIVFPSTRLVYKGSVVPQKEDSVKEFKTIYAMCKYACENYLQQYNSVYGVNYCILRIGVLYGSMINGTSSYGTAEFMLNSALNKKNISLYGDGSVRRTVTHIEDLCKIMYEAAVSETCINDVYNVGGEDFSLSEMAQLVAERFNINVNYIPWPDTELKIESGNTVFSSDKLDSILGLLNSHKFIDWIKTLSSD